MKDNVTLSRNGEEIEVSAYLLKELMQYAGDFTQLAVDDFVVDRDDIKKSAYRLLDIGIIQECAREIDAFLK